MKGTQEMLAASLDNCPTTKDAGISNIKATFDLLSVTRINIFSIIQRDRSMIERSGRADRDRIVE